MALLKANTGIGITNPTAPLHVVGNGLFTGIVSALSFTGTATSAISASNIIGGARGSFPYQSSANTTTFISPGTPGNILVTGGGGQDPYWASLSAVAGSFNGISVSDEGSLVGSAGSISVLNFVGSNISATASGNISTITVSNDAQYLTGTAPASVITQSNGLNVNGNLTVNGTLSVGGTSVVLNATSLQIKDRDIVLGVTTDSLENEFSTDLTATHGGIAIASTVGTPLINFPIQVGINSFPFTYKQFMWIKSGAYSGMGTDAWVTNYALSVGNTSTVANGSRLTVGAGFTVYDNLLYVPNIVATGISTLGSVKISSGIITSPSPGVSTVFYYGNGSGLTNISAASLTGLGGTFSISTSTSSTSQYLAFVSSASTTAIGINTFLSFVPSTGNLGIGSASPQVKVDVIGNAKFVGVITATTFSGQVNAGVGTITVLTSTNSNITNIQIAGISTITNGPVLIGSGTSTGIALQRLQVTGGAYISDSLGIGISAPTESLHVVGNILASGTVTANSDIKLKENVRTIDNALSKVLSLRGVEYDRIDSGEHQIGVIAQEVEKIIPEVVYPKSPSPDYETKSVAYANLIGLLIEAIKEQNQRIEELERKVGDI
jgi:hypothetical protein